jgi:methionine biosynthesis protein MetW
VLRQMLRIGRRAIVSFPNFGHWQVRWQLLTRGRMPMTGTWDREWPETPNIHPCTIRDFFTLCAAEGVVVERWLAVDEHGEKTPWKRSPWLANLFGEQALFLLRRGDRDAATGTGRPRRREARRTVARTAPDTSVSPPN